jgi:nitrate/nitrite transport system ATP-binding protein
MEMETLTENKIMLECHNIKKAYPSPQGEFVVLDDFQLAVKEKEFISIIGHSGCGKSTLLTMVAGLNDVTSGEILLDNNPINGAGPDRAVVFQSPSLFPWMTALENVALGVNQVFAYASKKDVENICKYYLSKVGLDDAFHKKAKDLSQGMKQRVGIARAFALKPKMLLLDEPFGMLDSMTRIELQDVLIEVWSKEKITAIMVTHDVDEAIFLSDRVIMMTGGPYAKVGDVAHINLERPRKRVEVIEHPDFYNYRQHLLTFLNH